MTTHVFGAILTAHGTAANHRGVTEGNTTPLQKLVWNGRVHTTVSAESIRFALRRRLAESEACNRTYDEDERRNRWRDPELARWGGTSHEAPFIDDDLLGFMQAEGARHEGDRGPAKVRRGVLEMTRAVSLAPWPGDVTFHAASPGASPGARRGKGATPIPYLTEIHATRYQYGFACTPDRLRVRARARVALRGLCALGEVAGNHGRFLFDFSPDSIVLRISADPAPRILYGFDVREGEIHIDDLVRKVRAGDIAAGELVVGGAVAEALDGRARAALSGALLLAGVKAACEAACDRLEA
ncbi:MAG TPA: type I-B CRISPR-associated protein Cas7/Cst2/DevR [Kofleriaceae bacterium]|nr:type I-B CRISPR-associated protein Cas7/Cst2/DevR [Kofleriaceae bacterium]